MEALVRSGLLDTPYPLIACGSLPAYTEEARRTVEIPRQVAAMLAAHKLRSPNTTPDAFVFATSTGRPIEHRNVNRALRAAQKAARDENGRPTFPVLHEPGPVLRGALPTFHSFRHDAASRAIGAGESAEEVSWQLGHRSSVVTRAVYTQEIKSAERTARRRARMEAEYASVLIQRGDRTDASGPDDSVIRLGT